MLQIRRKTLIVKCMIALLAVGISSSIVPKDVGAQGTGSVAGTVTDSASGHPIGGARVSAVGSDAAAVSNARGEYKLASLAPGDYVISVVAAGHATVSESVHVVAGASVTKNFSLPLGSALLPQIVVSASRSPLPAKDVTATVNAMTPEQVRADPARTTDDMLRAVPGLELPRASSTVSGAEEIVSIRGSDEGRTLVLLDDVPLNDPWGEWVQWNRAPRFQLDHVEVLEGGGSSLYGNYAMGGVISLFSRPITQHTYDVMASGGSRGAAEFSGYASDFTGRLGYSLSADYGSGGGYDVVAPAQRGPVDRASSTTRRSVNARAEYALGAATSVFASGSYFSDDRFLGTEFASPSRRGITSSVLGADIGSVLGGSIEARAFGQSQQYNSHQSVVNATRTVEIPLELQRIPSHDLGGSLIWSRRAGIFESISVGGDFRYTTGRLNEDLLSPADTVTGARASGGSQEVGGIFVQGVAAPTTSLHVEASARVDGWRSFDGSKIDNSTATPSVTPFSAKTNAAFAPRIGVRYQLLPSLAIRGSAYGAFRAPTLSEEYRTFFAGPNTFLGNPELTPEYLTGYDAGVDWQLFPMLEVRATAFLNRYRDLDDFTFKMPSSTPGGVILQRENLGRATSKGMEGEVALRPTEAITVAASYNYDDARIASTGAFVNRVPLQRASLRATYDDSRLATLNVVYRYEGLNHALGGGQLDPFSVVDLDARREFVRGAEIFADVENLFDRQYTVNVAGPLESIGLPRTIRAGISLHSL